MNRQEQLDNDLVEAVSIGDIQGVKSLLRAGANVHAQHNAAFFDAARLGHTKIVLLLLQAGLSVHTQNDRALFTAARFGQAETVRVLLEAGADPRADDSRACFRAIDNGHTETARILLQAGANVSFGEAIKKAVANNHTEMLQMLLQQWDISNIDCSGELILAAGKGHTETARILLQARSAYGFEATVNAQNNKPLRMAAKNGHVKTVQLLLQAGGDCRIISFQNLKKFLDPKFILSLSDEYIVRIETYHQKCKERYKWSEKINLLKSVKEEFYFDAKISLADLYYRPGELGYRLAVFAS